jgi:hypothetical protein
MMQAATRSTLADLVEQHVTNLVRESAVVNRHSKRGGSVSAAAGEEEEEAAHDDDDGNDDGNGGNVQSKRRRVVVLRVRRMIHHEDVNMALAWRGSEKLYVSGVPVVSASSSTTTSGGGDGDGDGDGDDDDDDENGNGNNDKANDGGGGLLGRILRTTEASAGGYDASSSSSSSSAIPRILSSSTVPRVDLNAYLRTEMAVRPPSELGLTLHWLAVDGASPLIPPNEVYRTAVGGGGGGGGVVGGGMGGMRPAVMIIPPPGGRGRAGLGDGGGDGDGGDGDGEEEEEEEEDASSIRIRELRHRLLSEELLLYYERVASTILSNDDDASGDDDDDGRVSRVVRGLRDDTGLQELVPFLSRYVASGLMSRRNLRRPDRCRRLVRVFDAMLDNPSLHLDLHLHQMFVPVGTCVVAGNLSSSSSSGGGGVVAGGGRRSLVAAGGGGAGSGQGVRRLRPPVPDGKAQGHTAADAAGAAAGQAPTDAVRRDSGDIPLRTEGGRRLPPTDREGILGAMGEGAAAGGGGR